MCGIMCDSINSLSRLNISRLIFFYEILIVVLRGNDYLLCIRSTFIFVFETLDLSYCHTCISFTVYGAFFVHFD